MAKPKIGEFYSNPLSADVGARDAFHSPCILCQAETKMSPGESIQVSYSGKIADREGDHSKRMAIVDPFLTEDVPAGGVFWAFIVPGKVNNLTHSFDIEGVISVEEAMNEYYTENDTCRGCY